MRPIRKRIAFDWLTRVHSLHGGYRSFEKHLLMIVLFQLSVGKILFSFCLTVILNGLFIQYLTKNSRIQKFSLLASPKSINYISFRNKSKPFSNPKNKGQFLRSWIAHDLFRPIKYRKNLLIRLHFFFAMKTNFSITVLSM